MSIYGYKKEVNVGGDIKPKNTHFDFDLDSGNKIIVSYADDTKVYHIDISDGSTTQLDVDPSDSSGDNSSRDHSVQAAWHDRDNQIIWFIDCDNPGSNFDAWKLDYSSSETSPTITEIASSPTLADVYALDVWVYSGNTYAVCMADDSGTVSHYVYDVDSDPFVEKDSVNFCLR